MLRFRFDASILLSMGETQITPDMAGCDMNDETQSLGSSEIDVGLLTGGGWCGWSDEQKEVIRDHFNYTLHRIELINKCWAHGPTQRKDLEPAPKSDLHSIILSGKSKGKKKKSGSIGSMISDEFDCYLQSLLIPETMECRSTWDDTFGDPQTIVLSPKERYLILSIKTSGLRSDHVEFGRIIKSAKTIFNSKKKEWNISDKWEK